MAFQLAAHNWMRPEPLEITLQRLSRLGYAGIEIMAEPARYDPAEVRPLLEKHGIQCWGGVSIMLASRLAVIGAGKSEPVATFNRSHANCPPAAFLF